MKRKNLTPSDYAALTRLDISTFAQRCIEELNPQTELRWNWHVDLIASKLEACRLGNIKRLMILMPPRHGKSLFASVAFPAWLLGHNASEQIICASYAQDLADKHARDCRTVMSAPWYRKIFPTRISRERQAVHEFTTTDQGWRYATSLGGVLTGRGANFIIIDDPLKPDEALSDALRTSGNNWYDGTLYSRLNDKRNGAIILIMQRLHEDDLVGHVLAQEPWEVVSLPAIAEQDEVHRIQTVLGAYTHIRKAGELLHPEREPRETLDRIRSTMGEYFFASQYQQSPVPYGGGLIKAEWFQAYSVLPEKFDQVIQSWDTANKPSELSSYSVCTTWGLKGKHHYLLHVLRKRLNYPELKRAVREQASAFGPQVILIEDKASGTQLIQELVAEGVPGITKCTPEGDKVMRMHAQTATIENGFVHLPQQAPWRADFVHEVTTFPRGKHDDQVDSIAQALDWIKRCRAADGWVEYYTKLATNRGRITPEMLGKYAAVKFVTMQAPGPYQNYYMSGTSGRAGRYSADAYGLIFNVHPEDVERLQALSCTIVEEDQAA
jgi:predicted phage terminase large subunit-like protein